MISALLLLITFCLCGNSIDGGFTRYTGSSPASSVQATEKEYIQPGISNIADNTELIKNVRALFESDGTAE